MYQKAKKGAEWLNFLGNKNINLCKCSTISASGSSWSLSEAHWPFSFALPLSLFGSRFPWFGDNIVYMFFVKLETSLSLFGPEPFESIAVWILSRLTYFSSLSPATLCRSHFPSKPLIGSTWYDSIHPFICRAITLSLFYVMMIPVFSPPLRFRLPSNHAYESFWGIGNPIDKSFW